MLMMHNSIPLDTAYSMTSLDDVETKHCMSDVDCGNLSDVSTQCSTGGCDAVMRSGSRRSTIAANTCDALSCFIQQQQQLPNHEHDAPPLVVSQRASQEGFASAVPPPFNTSRPSTLSSSTTFLAAAGSRRRKTRSPQTLQPCCVRGLLEVPTATDYHKLYIYMTASCVRELVAGHNSRCCALLQQRGGVVGDYVSQLLSTERHDDLSNACLINEDPSFYAQQPSFFDLVTSVATQVQRTLPVQDDDTFYTQFFPHAISRLYRHFRSVPAILTVSIIYLERLLSARPEFRVSRSAVFITYGVVLMLAAKFWDDTQYSNEHCALCLGLRLCVFNTLERSVLKALSYRLYVDAAAFRFLAELLLASSYRVLAQQSTKPITALMYKDHVAKRYMKPSAPLHGLGQPYHINRPSCAP